MAHLAILSIPGHGHVNPTVDLVAAAVARGHRVTYCVPAGFTDAVEAAGAVPLTYDSLLTRAPEPGTPKPTPEQFAAYLPFILLAESGHLLPQLIEAFRDDRPDVLLYDRTAYVAGRALGEIWDRPAIELFVSFAYNTEFSLARLTRQDSVLDPAHPAYAALAGRLAGFAEATGTSTVTVDDFVVGRTDEAIVFLPREFQYAGESFDPGYAFVGPGLATRIAASDGSDTGAVVYASLGTAFTDRPEAYAAIRTALARLDVPSLLSLGTHGGAEAAELEGGRSAGGLTVRPVVDQVAALASARVFVTHAGMGGVMEALWFGVPLVCLPGTTEQQAVARRVAELGLGVDLGPGTPTAAELTAAIARVRTDPAIRARVEAMRAVVRSAGGAEAALDAVEHALARPAAAAR